MFGYPKSFFLIAFLVTVSTASLAETENWSLVTRESLDESVRLDGVIEAVQRSTVSAQTSGTVLELPYDVDDAVEEGELIVRLEDSEQRARVSQAESAQAEALANLEDARQRFERVERLFEQNVASRSDFDQARNSLSAAEARIARARAELDEAQKQLDYTRVLAPFGGIVVERHVEIGESVNPGQPLMTGLSLEQLRVVVSVPQRYAEQLRRDQRATVTLNDGRVLKTGRMTFYPYADPGTHSFRLRLQLEEPDASLFPGMLVRVGIPVGEREALWIPSSSLVQRGELRAVYVLDDSDRRRLRQVRTGVQHDGKLEVLSGLSEGERIITEPRRD